MSVSSLNPNPQPFLREVGRATKYKGFREKISKKTPKTDNPQNSATPLNMHQIHSESLTLHNLRVKLSNSDGAIKVLNSTDISGIDRSLARLTYFQYPTNFKVIGNYTITNHGSRFSLELQDGKSENNEQKAALLQDLFIINVGTEEKPLYHVGLKSLIFVQKTMSSLRDTGLQINDPWAKMIRSWFRKSEYEVSTFLDRYCSDLVNPQKGGAGFFADRVCEETGFAINTSGRNKGVSETRELPAHIQIKKDKLKQELIAFLTNWTVSDGTSQEDTFRTLAQQAIFYSAEDLLTTDGINNAFKEAVLLHQCSTLYQVHAEIAECKPQPNISVQQLRKLTKNLKSLNEKKESILEKYNSILKKLGVEDERLTAPLSKPFEDIFNEITAAIKSQDAQLKEEAARVLELRRQEAIEAAKNARHAKINEAYTKVAVPVDSLQEADLARFFTLISQPSSYDQDLDIPQKVNRLCLLLDTYVSADQTDSRTEEANLKEVNDALNKLQGLSAAISSIDHSTSEPYKQHLSDAIQFKTDQKNELEVKIRETELQNQKIAEMQRRQQTLETAFLKANHPVVGTGGDVVQPSDLVAFFQLISKTEEGEDPNRFETQTKQLMTQLRKAQTSINAIIIRSKQNPHESLETVSAYFRQLEKINAQLGPMKGKNDLFFYKSKLTEILGTQAQTIDALTQLASQYRSNEAFRADMDGSSLYSMQNRYVLTGQGSGFSPETFQGLLESGTALVRLAQSPDFAEDVTPHYRDFARRLLVYHKQHNNPQQILQLLKAALSFTTHTEKLLTLLDNPTVQSVICLLTKEQKAELEHVVKQSLSEGGIQDLKDKYAEAKKLVSAIDKSGDIPDKLQNAVLDFASRNREASLNLSAKITTTTYLIEAIKKQTSKSQTIKNAYEAIKEYFEQLAVVLDRVGLTDNSDLLAIIRHNESTRNSTPVKRFSENFEDVHQFISEHGASADSQPVREKFESFETKPSYYSTRQGEKPKRFRPRKPALTKEDIAQSKLGIKKAIHDICLQKTEYLDPDDLITAIKTTPTVHEIPLLNQFDSKTRCVLLSLVYEFQVLTTMDNKLTSDDQVYLKRFENGWAAFSGSKTDSESARLTYEHMIHSAIRLASDTDNPVIFTKEQGKGLKTFLDAEKGAIRYFIASTGSGKTHLASYVPTLLRKNIIIVSPGPVKDIEPWDFDVPRSGGVYKSGWISIDEFLQNTDKYSGISSDCIVALDECDLERYEPLKEAIKITSNPASQLTLAGMSGTIDMVIETLKTVIEEYALSQEVAEPHSNPKNVKKHQKRIAIGYDNVYKQFVQLTKLFGNESAQVTGYKPSVNKKSQFGEQISEMVDTGGLVQNYRIMLTKNTTSDAAISLDSFYQLIFRKLGPNKSCLVVYLDPETGVQKQREIKKNNNGKMTVKDLPEATASSYPHPVLCFYFMDQERGTDFGEFSNFQNAKTISAVCSDKTQTAKAVIQLLGRLRACNVDIADDNQEWPTIRLQFPTESDHLKAQQLKEILIDGLDQTADKTATDYITNQAELVFRDNIKKGFELWLKQRGEELIAGLPRKEAAAAMIKICDPKVFSEGLTAQINRMKDHILSTENDTTARIALTGETLTNDIQILYFCYSKWETIFQRTWDITLRSELVKDIKVTVAASLEQADRSNDESPFPRDLLKGLTYILKPEKFNDLLNAQYNGSDVFNFYDLCRLLAHENPESSPEGRSVFKAGIVFEKSDDQNPRKRVRKHLSEILGKERRDKQINWTRQQLKTAKEKIDRAKFEWEQIKENKELKKTYEELHANVKARESELKVLATELANLMPSDHKKKKIPLEKRIQTKQTELERLNRDLGCGPYCQALNAYSLARLEDDDAKKQKSFEISANPAVTKFISEDKGNNFSKTVAGLIDVAKTSTKFWEVVLGDWDELKNYFHLTGLHRSLNGETPLQSGRPLSRSSSRPSLQRKNSFSHAVVDLEEVSYSSWADHSFDSSTATDSPDIQNDAYNKMCDTVFPLYLYKDIALVMLRELLNLYRQPHGEIAALRSMKAFFDKGTQEIFESHEEEKYGSEAVPNVLHDDKLQAKQRELERLRQAFGDRLTQNLSILGC